jgi:hypothetical protein
MNLVPAIKEMEREISRIQTEADRRKRDLKEGLKALRKLNTACENCGGEGKILRSRACAEDDRPDPNDPRDYRTCSYCRGTGLTQKENINA